MRISRDPYDIAYNQSWRLGQDTDFVVVKLDGKVVDVGFVVTADEEAAIVECAERVEVSYEPVYVMGKSGPVDHFVTRVEIEGRFTLHGRVEIICPPEVRIRQTILVEQRRR